ncbi:hypothetical protein [Paenibacillus sp. 481]|uniref:hypothetical protein n=1 Tax=Paenibacillus sp. 481 TaxID=2835869 RepID=UPI001E463A96|nr:hypothetical protein [Paenibacillus sp. 481]UHA73329.1 hypothetical protein KIK04_22605 [Paenibacillus sp. 481]
MSRLLERRERFHIVRVTLSYASQFAEETDSSLEIEGQSRLLHVSKLCEFPGQYVVASNMCS